MIVDPAVRPLFSRILRNIMDDDFPYDLSEGICAIPFTFRYCTNDGPWIDVPVVRSDKDETVAETRVLETGHVRAQVVYGGVGYDIPLELNAMVSHEILTLSIKAAYD